MLSSAVSLSARNRPTIGRSPDVTVRLQSRTRWPSSASLAVADASAFSRSLTSDSEAPVGTLTLKSTRNSILLGGVSAHEEERRSQTEQFGERTDRPLEINRLAGAESKAASVIVTTTEREALEHCDRIEHDQGRAQPDHRVIGEIRGPGRDQ